MGHFPPWKNNLVAVNAYVNMASRDCEFFGLWSGFLAVLGRYQWFGFKLSQIMTGISYWVLMNPITRVKGQPVFMRWIGRLSVDLSTIVKLGVKRHFRL